MEPSPHPAEQFRSLGRIYQLVGEFVTPIVVGLGVDLFAGTAPWGILVGVLFGMTIGGIRVYRLASKIGNPPPNPPPGPREGPSVPGDSS
jgi:F0F1-type ATP synthase assembly protein I